jgi:hypothetical protein
VAKTMRRMRRLLTVIGVTLAAAGAAATAPAGAGTFNASAVGCDGRTYEQPFLRWLDPFHYVLAPNGGLEGGKRNWTLAGGAKVVSGNESFYVGGKSDSRSLYLPSGSSARTRPMCIDLLYPTLRFFAANRGDALLSTLAVDVLYEDAAGVVRSLPIGIVTGGSRWQPTLPQLLLLDVLAPLATDGKLAIAFRFKPVGLGAKWLIDDVYVDPLKHG